MSIEHLIPSVLYFLFRTSLTTAIVGCALAEQARHMARRNLGRDCDIKTLLYTQEGVEEALKIWKEGEKRHKEQTGGRGERGKGRGVGAGRFREMMEKGAKAKGEGV